VIERAHSAEEKQHLDNLRRKDARRGAETAEISVCRGNYSASYFEGSAENLLPVQERCETNGSGQPGTSQATTW
jgi:hypothetical protein